MIKKTAETGRGRRLFSPGAAGFTLMELMISMTLLVIIVVITMGAMRLSSRAVAAGERTMEAQERLRTVLSLIDAQIQSQVPLTYGEGENRNYHFKGAAKALRFSTNHSLWGGQRGYVIVDYRVATDPTGNEILYASEQIPGIDGRQETRLIEAKEISFEYFQKDQTEEQGSWMNSIAEGTTIPPKIRMHLTMGTRTLSPVFSVRVWGEMKPGLGGKPR